MSYPYRAARAFSPLPPRREDWRVLDVRDGVTVAGPFHSEAGAQLAAKRLNRNWERRLARENERRTP